MILIGSNHYTTDDFVSVSTRIFYRLTKKGDKMMTLIYNDFNQYLGTLYHTCF